MAVGQVVGLGRNQGRCQEVLVEVGPRRVEAGEFDTQVAGAVGFQLFLHFTACGRRIEDFRLGVQRIDLVVDLGEERVEVAEHPVERAVAVIAENALEGRQGGHAADGHALAGQVDQRRLDGRQVDVLLVVHLAAQRVDGHADVAQTPLEVLQAQEEGARTSFLVALHFCEEGLFQVHVGLLECDAGQTHSQGHHRRVRQVLPAGLVVFAAHEIYLQLRPFTLQKRRVHRGVDAHTFSKSRAVNVHLTQYYHVGLFCK